MNLNRPLLACRAPTALLIACLVACEKPSEPIPVAQAELPKVLQVIATDVIYATYADFAQRADALTVAVEKLAAAPDDARLQAARQAWREARSPWEASEGFLFGPVVTLPIDGPIDSWPVNQVDLKKVLESDAPLTKATLDSLDVTLKGFHVIEYLLFGDSTSPVTPAGLSGRRTAYLQAAAASLAGEVHKLKDAWDPAHGDFVGALARAGSGSEVYPDRNQALREVLFAMTAICHEVANEKIYNVVRYDPPDRIQEESRFSDNSTADFADNLRSARNVYRGGYLGGTGMGIGALVKAKDPALDARLTGLFDSAIAATESMGLFGENIFTHRSRVDSASEAIRTLRGALILEAAPALGVEF